LKIIGGVVLNDMEEICGSHLEKVGVQVAFAETGSGHRQSGL